MRRTDIISNMSNTQKNLQDAEFKDQKLENVLISIESGGLVSLLSAAGIHIFSIQLAANPIAMDSYIKFLFVTAGATVGVFRNTNIEYEEGPDYYWWYSDPTNRATGQWRKNEGIVDGIWHLAKLSVYPTVFGLAGFGVGHLAVSQEWAQLLQEYQMPISIALGFGTGAAVLNSLSRKPTHERVANIPILKDIFQSPVEMQADLSQERSKGALKKLIRKVIMPTLAATTAASALLFGNYNQNDIPKIAKLEDLTHQQGPHQVVSIEIGPDGECIFDPKTLTVKDKEVVLIEATDQIEMEFEIDMPLKLPDRRETLRINGTEAIRFNFSSDSKASNIKRRTLSCASDQGLQPRSALEIYRSLNKD